MTEYAYRYEDVYRSRPWGWKKVVLIILGFMLLAVGIFLGGYYRGMEVGRKSAVSEHLPPAEKLVTSVWKTLPCIASEYRCPETFPMPPLLLISMDGFRADYIQRKMTPSIERLAQCGVRAQSMQPVFPTKTFPNHYSIVTGLFPESHGIVDNKMYDPVLGRQFRLGTQESLRPEWWNAEPLWVTAEKQGKKTGTFFWPGSDVNISGTRPSHYRVYDTKFPWECRVETVLAWLDLPPESRPSFLTLYVNEPDSAGHVHGPNSPEVNEALGAVDAMLDRLITGLHERNLLGCINIILVSDHGMADISCDNVLILDNYINMSSTLSVTGAFVRLMPQSDSLEEAVTNMVNSLRCRDPHMLVYRKENLPKRYHYVDNRRIEPVILDLSAGWQAYGASPNKHKSFCNGGAHGYDNIAQSMHALFVAHGPAFKQNITVQPFLNLELYELMAELLGVKALPNNGTKGSLHHLLQFPEPLSEPMQLPLPVECGIVRSQEENLKRIKAADCPCDQVLVEAMEPVIPNLDSAETNSLHTMHLPLGVPASTSSDRNSNLCLLVNRDYVVAYDKELKLPLWTSFTLQQKTEFPNGQPCWRADPRLPLETTPKCTLLDTAQQDDSGLWVRPLFPGVATSKETAWLLSNAVPTFANYSSILGEQLNRLLAAWTLHYSPVNVLMGPAFDVDSTGVVSSVQKILDTKGTYPWPVPTHYFAVITRCLQAGTALQDCDPRSITLLSFLLPHVPRPENCQVPESYIVEHVARAADVELLTGLRFFSSLQTYQAIRLRTTVLEGLWPLGA